MGHYFLDIQYFHNFLCLEYVYILCLFVVLLIKFCTFTSYGILINFENSKNYVFQLFFVLFACFRFHSEKNYAKTG